MFDRLLERGFQIAFQSHARAILLHDFPDAIAEIELVLAGFSIPVSEIIGSGGGETKGTQRLRGSLTALGWTKGKFTIRKTINGVERESISHEVDHVRRFEGRGNVALEIEWNNKDPFFDRDLENFKRLHAEGAISLGVISTRGAALQAAMKSILADYALTRGLRSADDLRSLGLKPTERQLRSYLGDGRRSFAEEWAGRFVADKFGAATTHWAKLELRVIRGVGNPCPLLLIGLPPAIVAPDHSAASDLPAAEL